MTEISAIIAASGKSPHLVKSLQSVQFCSEVILLDLGLEKSPLDEVASLPFVRIIKLSEPVAYIEQIREKSKTYAKHDTILFLDSDELIPPSLADIIKKHASDYDYFRIPRKNIILKKWIEHSRWWPDYQIRVFHKSHAVWPICLHAQPEVSGKEYIVPSEEKYAIEHHNYESLDDFLSRMMRYAKTEATQKYHSSKKYELHEAMNEGMQEFVSRYFAAEGYRDGMHGFLLAFLQMVYKFIVYFYVWEMRGYKAEEKDIPVAADNWIKSGYHQVSHWMSTKNLLSKGEKLKRKITNRLI